MAANLHHINEYLCIRPVSSAYRCDGPLHIHVLFRLALLSKEISKKTHSEQFLILRNGWKVDDLKLQWVVFSKYEKLLCYIRILKIFDLDCCATLLVSRWILPHIWGHRAPPQGQKTIPNTPKIARFSFVYAQIA